MCILVFCRHVYAGMKAIPRFREAIAFLKLRHQPAHIKYPLIALQIASNPGIYSAEQLNVREEVCHATCKQLDLMLLAGRANGRAHATVLCPYCLSVTYVLWLNGASYRKTV